MMLDARMQVYGIAVDAAATTFAREGVTGSAMPEVHALV